MRAISINPQIFTLEVEDQRAVLAHLAAEGVDIEAIITQQLSLMIGDEIPRIPENEE